MSASNNYNLIEFIRGVMISMVRDVESDYKVLLLDTLSTKVLSHAVKLHEIVEAGAMLIEKVTISRQPLPDTDAIYFISPNEESVKAVVKDFSLKDKPMYRFAHLFFTSSVPDSIMNIIRTNKEIIPRIKTFKELHLEFLVEESRFYLLDCPESLPLVLNPVRDIEVIARRLASICFTLGEIPRIRYWKHNQASMVIARRVGEELGHMLEVKGGKSALVDRARQHQRNNTERPTLLILDRTFDPISPLVHESTYQAMLYDLITIENNNTYTLKYTTQGGQETSKVCILNEADSIWASIRHMHIADASKKVADFAKEFSARSQAMQANAKDSKHLSQVAKNANKVVDEGSLHSLHTQLTSDCLAQYKVQCLSDITAFEQDILTGIKANSEDKINQTEVRAALGKLLADPKVSMPNKVRMLMIYIYIQNKEEKTKVTAADRDVLFKMIPEGLSSENQNMILRLLKLRVTVPAKDPKKEKKRKGYSSDSYENARYLTPLKLTLNAFEADDLDKDDFPFLDSSRDEVRSYYSFDQSLGIGPAPSGTSNAAPAVAVSTAGSGETTFAATWATGKSVKSSTVAAANPTVAAASAAAPSTAAASGSNGKMILFLMGGMCLSELRAAYECKKIIYAGSTHTLTPLKYLEQLKNIPI